jgi:protein translocase SecG subunit
MTKLAIVLIVLDLAFSVGVTLAILLMSPKGAGLGAISGGATVFHTKSTKDSILEKLAAVFSIAFVITSLFLAVFKVF